MTPVVFCVILFVFGAIVGSFLNVVIVRFGTGMSIARGRSKCFSCGHSLAWYDLVPFFSYIFLKGKCRYCHSKISSRYFLVEFLTAFLFAASGVAGLPATPIGWIFILLSLAIISFYITIAFYDNRHSIIPDYLSYSVAIVAFIFSILTIISGADSWWRILAGFFVAAPFAFFFLISRGKWMGLGDAKLALSIGWWLGASLAFGAIFISVFAGAIIGVFILFAEKIQTGKVKWGKHEIPFGPFLIIGALVAHFFGITIWTFLGL